VRTEFVRLSSESPSAQPGERRTRRFTYPTRGRETPVQSGFGESRAKEGLLAAFPRGLDCAKPEQFSDEASDPSYSVGPFAVVSSSGTILYAPNRISTCECVLHWNTVRCSTLYGTGVSPPPDSDGGICWSDRACCSLTTVVSIVRRIATSLLALVILALAFARLRNSGTTAARHRKSYTWDRPGPAPTFS
jgi:hypothetical protein